MNQKNVIEEHYWHFFLQKKTVLLLKNYLLELLLKHNVIVWTNKLSTSEDLPFERNCAIQISKNTNDVLKKIN